MSLPRRQMLKLRVQYGNLASDGYADLLQAALRGQGGDALLRAAMLEAGLDLRPRVDACAPDDMRWKHWTALAMRFFPALLPGGRVSTVADVREWLEHDRALTQALLFSDVQLVYQVLAAGLDSQDWRGSLPAETPEQALILDIVRYHLSSTNLSERQVGNWSVVPLDQWAGKLTERLQVGLLQELSSVAERLVLRLGGADQPADPAMFKVYMERFRAMGLDWAYSQALGYHNELKRRYRMASQAATWVMVGAVSALLVVIALLAARLMGVSWVLWGLLLILALLVFSAAGFHVVRFFVILFSLGGAVEAQLKTLGEIEALCLSDSEEVP